MVNRAGVEIYSVELPVTVGSIALISDLRDSEEPKWTRSVMDHLGHPCADSGGAVARFTTVGRLHLRNQGCCHSVVRLEGSPVVPGHKWMGGNALSS